MKTPFYLTAAVLALTFVIQASTKGHAEESMWERAQRAIDASNARDAERRDEERRHRDYEDTQRGSSSSYTPVSNRYAAIVYSTSTHKWGYSHPFASLDAATEAASKNCGAADGKRITYAKNGWYCALAVGTGGAYGSGYGPTAAAAKAAALDACRKYSNECHIEICVGS